MDQKKRAGCYAVLAAALYALSTPVSKLLLTYIPTTAMAGLLYLGAGAGMYLVQLWRKPEREQPLTTRQLPYTIAMVLLDIAAPVCFMIGLKGCGAAHAALLNNFEIVATALIAWLLFGEKIRTRLWLAIVLVTAASIMLSMEDAGSLKFSWGSIFILLACLSWGFENNCTRKLSTQNPAQIVMIKGLCSGTGSLILSFAIGERYFHIGYIVPAIFLGFVSYGLSIYFYIYAQRYLGAAKTSAYYAVSPFIGAGFSLLIFWEVPTTVFLAALAVMAAGTYAAFCDEEPAQR